MTHFLVTDENPDGYRLEDILTMVRKDIILRATKIVDDARPEARHVLDNNVKILQLLTESIGIAEDSTRLLDKRLGPHQPGEPRIGTA
jgi:UDP-N-acetylmuramyl tripeptide synthase